MSSNISNRAPFLRVSREIPEEIHQLSVQVSKMYIDIAQTVNARTIGEFPTNRSAVNGENWFFTNQRQQGFRQIYPFSAAGSIPHNLNTTGIYTFTKIYGTFFSSATNTWYPLPYVDTSNATNQINVIVNANDIVITAGGGTPPSITSGVVVLEWISNI